MQGMQPAGRQWIAQAAVHVLLLSALQISSAMQCSTGNVTVMNGKLVFPEVSQDDFNFSMIPESSSGMLDGWYALAESFVDAVRPGGLPYPIIQGVIEDQHLACDVITPQPPGCGTEETQSGSFDVIVVFQMFTEWWTGIIIVLCVGILVGVGFLVAGCVFLCCRCCGRCGAKQSQEWHRRSDWIRGITTFILVIFTLGLIASAFTVYNANQQFYENWDATQDTVNQVFNQGINYVQDTLEDGTTLICHSVDVSLLVLDEVDLLFENLTAVAVSIGQDIEDTLNSLSDITDSLTQDSIDSATVLLNETQSISSTLVSFGSSLNDSLLSHVDTLADGLKLACQAASIFNGALDDLCDTIPTELGSSLNFSGIPELDLSFQISSLANTTIGTINLTKQIEEGFDALSNATEEVAKVTNSLYAAVRSEVTIFLNETVLETWRNTVLSGVEKVLQNGYKLEDCLGSFPSIALSPSLTVGEIRQCLLNSAITELKRYDIYRYAFGIVVVALSLVLGLFMLVGVCVGFVGFRRKRPPPRRTSLSHCGGIILLIGVGLAFVFGFCLSVVAAVGFFFGSNAQKACQSVASPRYELFSEVVDNTTLWQGSLLGSFIYGDASLQFSLSEALRNCENNQALYRALNLSNILDLEKQLFSANETFQTINSDLVEASDTLVLNFPPDLYLPTLTQDAVVNFARSGLDKINTNAFGQLVSAPAVLNAAIQNLTDLQTQFILDDENTLANLTEVIIAALVEVRDSVFTPEIQTELNELENKVDQLISFVEIIAMNASQVAGRIITLSTNLVTSNLLGQLEVLTGPHTQNIVGFIGDFIQHAGYHITDRLGQCRPIHEMYVATHETLCVNALNGLNGFWWSVGVCSILFIPIIILAIISSRYYSRTKQTKETQSAVDLRYTAQSAPKPGYTNQSAAESDTSNSTWENIYRILCCIHCLCNVVRSFITHADPT